MKKFIMASLVAAAILATQARATTIVFYSFNTNGFAGGTTGLPASDFTNYVTTANTGSNITTFSNFNGAGQPLTILSSVSGSPNNHGFPAGNSVSQNAWNGNASYFQFTLDATGYQNLVLAWAGNRSSTGPTNLVLRYSSDGGSTFSDFATFAAPSNSSVTQDLTSVTSLNNNSIDVFRIVGVDVGAAAGTIKIDNFSIDATAIPEPSTVMLVGIGFAGMLALRRRRA